MSLVRAALLTLAGAPALAQDLSITPPSRPDGLGTAQAVAPGLGVAGAAVSATGGIVRVLDKIDGSTTDLTLADGETGEVGTLTITLAECRYPADNPAGDAYALLSIRTRVDETALFEGWMIASSPAISAMDHPRYDVWAMSCAGT